MITNKYIAEDDDEKITFFESKPAALCFDTIVLINSCFV